MKFDRGPNQLRRTLAVGVVILLTCVAGSAEAGTSSRLVGSALPVLRVGLSGDIPNFNPALAGSSGGAEAQLSDLAYDGLFHLTPTRRVTPSLATKWHYFTTGRGPYKDFEFTLRNDARFSDGTPVTAQAVVGWLQYFATNGVGYVTLLGPNPQFVAVGRLTVQIHLAIPQPDIPPIFSDDAFNWGFPASPQAVANPSLLATGTYGAGPYMRDASQSVRGDHYTYVPNPYYYDKKAIRYSQIYIKIITDPSSMLQALQSGQLDVAQGDPTTAAAAKSAGFSVNWSLAAISVLALSSDNGQVPALKDLRVRQAINYAIDRKTIVTALLGPYGTPTSELIAADANPGLEKYYPYNPAKAKSLLAAAGYANGFTLKVLVQPPFGVVTGPTMQAVAQNLDNVGIHLVITTPANTANWLQSYKSYPAFQVLFAINTTVSRWGLYVSPSGPYNTWGPIDPIVDKLYWAAFKAKDPTSVWKQMWARITKQAYFAPVLAYPTLYYHTKSITGVVVTVKRVGTPLITEWSTK